MEGYRDTKKKRILIVENSTAFTGGFKAIFQSVQDLREDYEFLFVIPKGSQTRSVLEQNSFTVYEMKFAYINRSIKSVLFYLPRLISSAIKLKRLVKREQIDLVHSNDLYNLCPVALRIFYKIPLVTHIRILPTSFPKPVYKFWVFANERIADKIVGVSKIAIKSFHLKNKCEVIYNRTPNEEIYPYSYNTTNAEGNISLICLANFTRGKGQDLVIQAFRIAAAQNSNLRLTFAGSDLGLNKNRLYKEELELMAQNLGLENLITFKSFVTDIEKELKQHQIMLNFSESESFSFTVMEALFYGIPCIATNSGGPAEIIENGISGVLVYKRDPELLAGKILNLSESKTKRKEMSINSRLSVRSRFSKEKSVRSMQVIYDSLLKI